MLQLSNARLHQSDLLKHEPHRATQNDRQPGVLVCEVTRDLGDAPHGSLRYRQPELSAEAAQGVDAPGACAHPGRARAMQRLQRLLLDRLHRHRFDVCSARRLQQRDGIGCVSLVTSHVGAHILCRQQSHLDAPFPKRARPVMRRAARFHHNELHFSVSKPALELRACEPMMLEHTPCHIGHRELENVLCQVNRHGCSIHSGLLLSFMLKPTRASAGTMMPNKTREESIPSFEPSVTQHPWRATGAGGESLRLRRALIVGSRRLNASVSAQEAACVLRPIGGLMKNDYRIPTIKFSKVYPLYVEKAERKNRTREEVDQVICWLTGYSKTGLQQQIRKESNFQTFFAEAPAIHPNSSLIKGVVCGVRVEEIEDPLVQKARYLDKLIDELAKGKALEKIMR